MNAFKIMIPVLSLFLSCKKSDEDKPSTSITDEKGRIAVECDNCLLAYGMPDQYAAFNVASQSTVKYPYTYTGGYALKIYITAEDHEQLIKLSIYDPAGNVIYQSAATKSESARWDTSILLPAE